MLLIGAASSLIMPMAAPGNDERRASVRHQYRR
jgi:hypothetical protein